MNILKEGCECGPIHKLRGNLILIGLVGFLIYTLSVYIATLRKIRRHNVEKIDLKEKVKRLSQEVGKLVNFYVAATKVEFNKENFLKLPQTIAYFEDIENSRPIQSRNSFYFIMDQNDNVYVHGDAKELIKEINELALKTQTDAEKFQNRAFTNLYNLFKRVSHGTPEPVSTDTLVEISKKGGGFVFSRWKDNFPILTYVFPVAGTDLIVGGTIPWDERHIFKN